MQKKLKYTKRGLSLVEMLFGVSIFIAVVLVLTMFSRNVWLYNAFIGADLASVDAGRKVLKTMVSEIRTAGTANNGAYTLALANNNALTFYSDIDNDGLKEKVRYFLSGTTLQKGVIKPAGSPLTYNAINEKISNLMNNVTNTSLFEYYDKNYDGTTNPLSSPVNIPLVRLIKINILSDLDQKKSPVPKTFSTQVSIRNLKDNL
jgi:hypothetical protein